jgi:hypothetical protein
MNGWTPTPTNKERVEYDLQRNEEFIAKSLAYNLSRTFATTEADADQLHELITICDTDPAHILNTELEPDWNQDSPKLSALTKLPPAKITTMQQFAEARDRSFNQRYYSNNGLPYFPHEKRGK